MELLYLYIKDYPNEDDSKDFHLLNDKEFSFSPKYDIKYYKNSDELSISDNGFDPNFWDSPQLSLSAIVGENGAGKTTLFRFIFQYMFSRQGKYIVAFLSNNTVYVLYTDDLNLTVTQPDKLKKINIQKKQIKTTIDKISGFPECLFSSGKIVYYSNIADGNVFEGGD